MTRSIALSLLSKGNTGTEILKILESITSDNVSTFDYIESPMIEQVLGVPIDVIEFWWYNLLSGAAVIRSTHTIRGCSYSWWQYVALDGCVVGGRRRL